jgi:hypothetical protein
VDTAPRRYENYVEIPFGPRASTPKPEPAPAPAPVPASQPVQSTPEIDALIRQLGDADFRKRESAVTRLKEIGPPALPALRQARDAGGDPEVVSRADGIIRFFERPPVPGRYADSGRDRGARFRGGAGNVNMRFSVENGNNRVEVREPGRTIRIEHGPNGIQMSVTGVEDGKQITRDYQARTPQELARQHPEAFDLFQRWTGQAAARGVERELRARRFREQLDQPRRGIQLLPLVPEPAPVRPGVEPGIDDIRRLHDMMRLRRDNLLDGAAADFEAQTREMLKFMEQLAEERKALRQEADAIAQRVRESERRAADGAAEKSN